MRYHALTGLAAVAVMLTPAGADELPGGERHRLAVDHEHPEDQFQHHHQWPGGFGPVVHPHVHGAIPDRLEWDLTLGLDSRYVSEGRDNLPGEGGIFYADAVAHWHALGGAVFGGVLGIAAWDADYEEVNLAAGYEWEVGTVALSLAGTYLWFPEDDEDDVELGLGAEWVHQSGVGLSGEAYWSLDADGWFGQARAFVEWRVCEAFTLVPAVVLGVNQGYVTDGHDGFNHIGAEVEGVWAVSDHVEVTAYGAFLDPIDARTGDGLRDLFWAGAAVVWSY